MAQRIRALLGSTVFDSHRLVDYSVDRQSEFSRSVSEAAKQATEEMRALIERAIKNGQPNVVR